MSDHASRARALTLIVLVSIVSHLQLVPECDAFRLPFRIPSSKFYEGPLVLPKEIMEARGYLAEDFHIQTQDGYTLRITRGRNPLIREGKGGAPGRVPILFIHGVVTSYNCWVINSFDAKPSVLTSIDFANTSLAELNARLGDLPSAKSLPLLAMDCGHEVFILSRRGFPGSQKLKGDRRQGTSGDVNKRKGSGPITAFLSGLIKNSTELMRQIPFSFDSEFWDFSLDEQGRYDLPLAIDFVRNQTGWQNISLVGHSAGGFIALGSLIIDPEVNKKLSSVILWNSGFSLGHGDIFNLIAPFEPLLRSLAGPVPAAFATKPLQQLSGLICATKLAQSTLCAAVASLFYGYGGIQMPMKPEFINSVLYSSSSHEVAQAMQVLLHGGKVHTFSHTPEDARPYDLGRITNRRLSFWIAPNDFLVSARDADVSLRQLKVPYRRHLLEAPFNHFGFYFHRNNSRLAIIPTLKEIHELSALERS